MNENNSPICGQDHPHDPSEIGIRDGVRYSMCTRCETEIAEVLYPETARMDQDRRFEVDTVTAFLGWLDRNGYLLFKETRYGVRGRGGDEDDVRLAHRFAGVDYDTLRAESAAILASWKPEEGTNG